MSSTFYANCLCVSAKKFNDRINACCMSFVISVFIMYVCLSSSVVFIYRLSSYIVIYRLPLYIVFHHSAEPTTKTLWSMIADPESIGSSSLELRGACGLPRMQSTSSLMERLVPPLSIQLSIHCPCHIRWLELFGMLHPPSKQRERNLRAFVPCLEERCPWNGPRKPYGRFRGGSNRRFRSMYTY